MQRWAIAAFGCSVFSCCFAVAEAPPAAQQFDVSRVRVERTSKDRIENESAPPLFVAGVGRPDDEIAPEFATIVEGHAYPGARAVYGYLGRGYSAFGEIVAQRFERVAGDIRLEFRYREWKEKPQDEAEEGWAGYFLAPLPADLPDGTYRVSVKVHELPANVTGRAELEAAFAKPDASTKTREADLAAFEKLPPKDRVARYRAVAEAADYGAPQVSWNWTPLSRIITGSTHRTLAQAMKHRLIATKFEVSPYLIEALREECERDPDARHGDSTRGTAGELLQMLTAIGDARAAPILLEIVSGKRTCSRNVREAALEALELLTCVRFRRDGSGANYDAVLAPEFVVAPRSNHQDGGFVFEQSLAPIYVKWLAEHPADEADRTPWRKSAAKQARAWLASDDIEEAYAAAHYLRHDDETGLPCDDDSDRTTDLIAAVMHKFVPDPLIGEERFPEYRYGPTGKPIPGASGNWSSLLTAAGPLHPRHLALVVRAEREAPHIEGYGADMLNVIGGRAAMEHRYEMYRKAVAAVVEMGIDPQRKLTSAMPDQVLQALYLLHFMRYGIERWAGRIFETEQDLQAWFEGAEKDRSQQQWLEAGLPILAAQADSGDARAQLLLRVILEGALPDRPDATKWWQYGYTIEIQPESEAMPPFRAKWLGESQSRLRCDPVRFRIHVEKPAKQPN